MCKKKAWRILVWMLGMLLFCTVSAGIGLTARAQGKARGNYVLAAENDRLALYYHPDTLAILVRDKATGNEFDSVGPDAQEGDLNATWTGMKESGVSVECRLENGNVRTWTITGEGASVETQQTESGFRSSISFSGQVGFELQVSLTDTGVSVLIPEASIVEAEDSGVQLQSIYVYPFLGASYGYDNPGYLFVPDGCGALISTGQKTIAAENYEKQIYGSDLGMGAFKSMVSQSLLRSAEEIYMPVFGSILEEGKSGFAGIVTEGDEYCRIAAYVSGIRTPFNLIMPKFLLRETYLMRLDQSGTSLTANQEKRNPGDLGITYVFLSGDEADYVGIAGAYRQYLLDQGTLTKKEEKTELAAVKIELILSEQKKGLLWSKTLPMTTVEQADQILQELYDAGLQNLDVVLRGYSDKGASGAAPSDFSFTGKVGSRSQWKKEIKKLTEQGIDVSLYSDFSRGYEGKGGYGSSQEAQAINRTMLTNFDNGMYNWLAPAYIAKQLNSFAEKAEGIGLTDMAVEHFGSTLYSNWNKKNPSTRADAVNAFTQADSAGLKLNLYAPYAYLWGKCDGIYDIPTGSSNYYIFTETVPFMQIVLKGCIPYYSEGWNFHANASRDLLECVEYGAYPSWYLSWEDSVELINTPSSWLYSTQYAVWKDSVIEEYGKVSQVLGQVSGACIRDRVVLEKDVVRMDYDNGISIYINYRQTDWTGDGVTVEAESFLAAAAGADR
ncbi:MAG: hypothetical protein HFH83_06055 [Lachnospiraceae bacterium]|nr:hypothetical protein [Lachnospiraceae bacterium]